MSKGKEQEEPEESGLRAWAPRLFAFGLLALALIPLFGVFRPLLGFLLLAISLAVITSPILFSPLDAHAQKKFPTWDARQRRTICGIGAMAILVILALLPLLPLLYASSGSVTEMLVGVALGDEAWREVFLDRISNHLAELKELYPRLPIEEERTRAFLAELLGDAREFSGSFLGYLFRGASGFVAELVLSLMALAFLYAHGTDLTRTLLERAGFAKSEINRLARLHGRAVMRLWWDTVMTAIIRGLCLGGAAWLFGDFPFLPVALVGAFAGLVPVMGAAMVWLPLASLAWTRGDFDQAVILAAVCIALNALVSVAKRRMGTKLYDQGVWTSFLLFLSIIGGVLAYGASGFVIGPAAVIAVSTLGRFLLPMSDDESSAQEV